MKDEFRWALTIVNILILLITMGVCLPKSHNGVENILNTYNNAIVQCKDDACRQYVNVFYVRALHELTSGVDSGNEQ